MASGLREDIDLDIAAALRDVDKLEAALEQTAKSFRVQLARALDVLRGTAHVDITADARQLASSITSAVDAADATVSVSADVSDALSAASEVESAFADPVVLKATDEVTPKATTIAERLGDLTRDDQVVVLKAEIRAAEARIAQIDKALQNPTLTRAEVRVLVDQRNDATRRIEQLTRQVDEFADVSVDANKRVSSSFDGVRTAVAGALAALGTRFVVDQIGQMIDAASDLAESQSKVSVVFGESASEIEQWGDTSAESVGLAKQQALEAAGTFGNLFTALGLSKDAAADLSPEVVQLGADFASFNNLEVPETLEKLRSGLVGEIEPLRSLGVSFNAAQVEAKAMALQLADANGEVSEGAKVQARWALILEQSAAAQGDFARTSDGLANQQRIMTAEIGNARAEIGQRLLPVMLDAVRFGRGFLDFFLSLPEPVQNLTLGFVALGIALGPVLLAVGNITRVVGGVSAAITGLANLLGTSTLIIGGWAAALAAVGAVVIAFRAHQQAQIEYQAAINDGVTESVNNFALLSKEQRGSSDAMRDAAVAAFMAAGGIGDLGDSARDAADEIAVGSKIAQDSLAAIERDTPKAAAVLEQLADESGITRERIVQLANSLGVNLANATDEQREKLGAALTQISEARTPTERLGDAAEVLGNQFATSAEEIEAFEEALDAALGVYLGAEQATIRVRERVDELTAAMKEGRKEKETDQQFTDRMRLGAIDLTDAIADEVRALTEAGDISTDVAAQKEALTSRMLHLADALGGEVGTALREHAARVASIPEEAVTDVKADTSEAKSAMEGLTVIAAVMGSDVGKNFARGMAQGTLAEREAARSAAAYTAKAMAEGARDALEERSPSRVGMNVGIEFVNGIVLGLEQQAQLAYDEAVAFGQGMESIWHEAASVTAEEAERIYGAQNAVVAAQERLDRLRADSATTANVLAEADRRLADAQHRLNETIFAARVATGPLQAEMARRGQNVGIEFVNGIRLGIDRESALALQASEAVAGGLGDVWREAATVTTAESLQIFAALDAVREAQERLNWIRADATSTAEQLHRAELELADAQSTLNDAVFEGRDASEALAEALEAERQVRAELNDELDRTLAAFDAATGKRFAQRDVTDAQVELNEARRRQRDLPGEIEAAEEELSRARRQMSEDDRDSIRRVEEAERALADLQEERRGITERVRDASEALTEAQLRLIDAQRTLNEAGLDLTETQTGLIDELARLGEQAGLTQEAIDKLTESIEDSIDAARDAAGTGGQRSDNYRPGTGGGSQPYGPPGTIVTRNGRRYIVDYDGQLTLLSAASPRVTALSSPSTSSSMATTSAKSATGGTSRTTQIGPNYLSKEVDVDLVFRKAEFATKGGRFDDDA